MAIDAGIYSQIRQPQQPDLIGMAGQFAQLQGAQQQNRLAQVKMDEYERGVQSQNRLRTLLEGGADAQGLVKAGFLKEGQDWEKNQAEVTSKRADADKKRLELVTGKITQYRDYLSNVNDPQTAAQWLQAQYQDPDVGPIMSKFAPIDQAVQRIPQEPSAFQQWKQQQALGATKFVEMNKPTITTRNLGGTTDTLATEGLTGVTRTLNSAKNTQSPDNAASVAATMRGQNMTDQRARERLEFDRGASVADAGGPDQAALVKRFGKPPQGYRWKPDGSQEAVPGGPADIKAGELGRKQEIATRGGIAQADRVVAKVDEALARVGNNSAGLGGSILAKVPGTDATNLRADLETIKANLGFAELQAMRDASPTGGALGQVAVQELTALQSTVASLDPNQSPEKLRTSLAQVRKHYENWKGVLEGRLPDSGGGKPPAPSGPKPGTVQDGYRFKGGNPADRNSWEKV